MTKEIIIDGINVAGCCCFENSKCLWSKKYYENPYTPDCKLVDECYYKQLKCLEQENEKLKEEKENLKQQLEIDKNQINYFIEENEKLKEENEEINERKRG